MTTGHPNAQVLRDFFDAFGTADRERLAELTTPDMVWHFPGHSPISGDWHGIDGPLHGRPGTQPRPPGRAPVSRYLIIGGTVRLRPDTHHAVDVR